MRRLPPGRQYVQAFVDLLGLSAALLELDHLSNPAATPSSKQQVFDSSIGKVIKFRELVEQTYSLQAPPIADLSDIAPEQRAAFLESFNHGSKYRWFSDCCIITIPLDYKRPDQLLNGLLRLCINLSSTTIFLLSESQLLRGGVEIGNGVDVGEGEVLSSALAKAHELESRVAVYPRVAVGPHLRAILREKQLEHTNQTFPDSSINLSDSVQRMLKHDAATGTWFVDFLGPDMLRLFQRVPYGAEILTQAASAVRSCLNSPPGEISDRGLEKWRWLKHYMQESGVWSDE